MHLILGIKYKLEAALHGLVSCLGLKGESSKVNTSPKQVDIFTDLRGFD